MDLGTCSGIRRRQLTHTETWEGNLTRSGFLWQDQCLLPASHHNVEELVTCFEVLTWFLTAVKSVLKSMLWQHGLRRSGKCLCIAWCITSIITVSIDILLCEKMLWRVRNGHAEVRTSGMRKIAPVLAVQICLQRYAKVMMRTQMYTVTRGMPCGKSIFFHNTMPL